MLYGKGEVVDDPVQKRFAMDQMLEKFSEGRSTEARAPNASEMKATVVISFPIEEASAKIRTGPPIDDPEDLDYPTWSGVKPVTTIIGSLE